MSQDTTAEAARALLELQQDSYVRRKYGHELYVLAGAIEARAIRRALDKAGGERTAETASYATLARDFAGTTYKPAMSRPMREAIEHDMAARQGQARDCLLYGCQRPGNAGEDCDQGACRMRAELARVDAEPDPDKLTVRERLDRAIRAVSPTTITLTRAEMEELKADPEAARHLGAFCRRYRGIQLKVDTMDRRRASDDPVGGDFRAVAWKERAKRQDGE